MSPRLVFLFPGQSSRDAGMFDRLEAAAPDALRRTLEAASAVLGRPPLPAALGDPGLERNHTVQLAVFVASHAWLLAAEELGLRAELSVGMSLGEYNHLVHAGALRFEEALRLVDARGRAYDQGPRGVMAAVHPAALGEVEALVARVRDELGAGPEELDVSNENSSTQQVVAGSERAVERLLELADEELCAEGRVIERRVPMHTLRFRPAADALRPALEAAEVRVPEVPYAPNVLGTLLDRPSPGEIRALLLRHVYARVRLAASLAAVAERAGAPVFVEVGPRTVFHDLIARDHRAAPRFHLDAPEEPPRAAQTCRTIRSELGRGL